MIINYKKKMAFDKDLDKELFKKELDFEMSKIIVSVMSYNEGQKKIQIARMNKSNDDLVFAKLGRLTKEEAKQVIVAMQECLTKIE